MVPGAQVVVVSLQPCALFKTPDFLGEFLPGSHYVQEHVNCAKGRAIRDKLKEKGSRMAAEALEVRLALCEHAEQLRLKSDAKKIDAVPVAELQVHLEGTKELWDDVPFATQVRVVFRFALEKFKESVEAAADKQEGCIVDFVAALDLQSSEDTDKEGFKGQATTVSWLVQQLMQTGMQMQKWRSTSCWKGTCKQQVHSRQPSRKLPRLAF